jgi:hypothetical protein
MKPNLNELCSILSVVLDIIRREDKLLYEFLSSVSLPPFFATSWVITWLSHDLPNLEVMHELFKFFMEKGPQMPIYFSAAIVLFYKNQVLDVELDMGALHQFLRELPKKITFSELSRLLEAAQTLQCRYKPQKYRALDYLTNGHWRAIQKSKHPLDEINALKYRPVSEKRNNFPFLLLIVLFSIFILLVSLILQEIFIN